MLEITNNVKYQKNTIHESINISHSLCKLDSSVSVVHSSKKSLLNNKEINLDVLLKKDKQYDYNNTIYNNFNSILNNLLNFSHTTEIKFDNNNKESQIIKDKNIKKKIIDQKNDYKNNPLLNFFLKKIKLYNTNTIKTYNKILLKKKLLSQIKIHQNQCNKKYILKNIKTVNHAYLSKLRNQFFYKTIQFCKDNFSNINHNKKIILSLYRKNIKNNLDLSEKNNKMCTMTNYQNISEILNQEEYAKLNKHNVILKNFNHFIKWTNLINHKILFLVANQTSQAEIHLTPESLGLINIFMDMKNNDITLLQLISKNNLVRALLNNYIPFLSNELQKKGIKLEQYNIFQSFKSNILNKYKYFSNKRVNNFHIFQKKINIYKKNMNFIKNENMNWYV